MQENITKPKNNVGDRLSLLKIGYVSSHHGTKGELEVKFLKTRVPSTSDKIYFERDEDLLEPVDIISLRKHQQNWILEIPGCTTLSSAKKLVGYSIGLKKAKLPENTYWIDDIVGCKVYSVDKILLGRIKNVISTGANDVYVISDASGKEKLVPAIKSVISTIDIENKTVIIDPLPGLLDVDEC